MKDIYQKGVKYLAVGVANTFVGYGMIFGLMWGGLMPEIANILGYSVGFIVSYLLNKRYTFASPASHKRDLPRFGLTMGLAYIAQLGSMSTLHRVCEINPYVATIIGSGVYVVVGFFVSKNWAFVSHKKGE
ncbi:GtrA family protein [Helicobacter labetoulli]|uniref:GtrA family protein n=1 Tax=Helicobacter labetoulli TaxID=2315333 RepID=UPI000EF6C8E8|nr:GtrA family protein [Helicobacter labetoulli]